jgi:hypothetical protein
MASAFDEGLLVGLLVGEGHFGGDGRQPQITLRMHERHEALFRWLETTFPGGHLYGPYDHGGRRYYQWMVRGAYLRDEIVPLLHRVLTPSLDRYAHSRFMQMCTQYARQLGIHSALPSEPEHGTPLTSNHPEIRDQPVDDRVAAAFAALRRDASGERSTD